VRLAEGFFAGIDDLLERLLVFAETQKRTGSVIEILLTQALAHRAQCNQSQALAVLERALALAEPEGYLRIFVDEGEEMRLLILDFRTMFEKQAPPGIHRLSAYVNHLLAAFPESTAAVSQHKIANRKHSHLVPLQGSEIENRNSIIVDPLTDRELEILRLIADGQSNAEISRQLYLALSTVKGHNLRIFNKLQAQNRTEAVARARELGLL
jgi:LuxR family maltose regulon positive regulatory protein